jgi:hypothetical protein
MIVASTQTQPTDISNRERIYLAGVETLTAKDLKDLRKRLDDISTRGVLTQRDERLLEYLRELNVLSVAQIHRLFWLKGKAATAYKRVQALSKYLLFSRVRSPDEMANWGLTPSMVFTLGAAGRMWLQDDVSDDYVARRLKRDRVMHDLLTAELATRLVETVVQSGSEWSVTLGGERAASFYERGASKPLLSPDALLVIRRRMPDNKVMVLPLFVEMDASRESHGRPSSDWGRKAHGYDALGSGREAWQQHPALGSLNMFPRVLVLTHGAGRLKNLMAAVNEHRRQPVIYQFGLWQDLIAAKNILTDPFWWVLGPNGEESSGQSLISLNGAESPKQPQPLISA